MKKPFAVLSPEYMSDLVQDFEGRMPAPNPTFPDEINRRLQIVHDVAVANAKLADQVLLANSTRLAHSSRSASTSQKKMIWLRKSADAFNTAYIEHSACASGCNHCCHIPVSVSETEAKLIAAETGRKLSHESGNVSLEASPDNPCPFLEAGKCSIYKSRPLACRLHLNMDNDDLLCQLKPGTNVPVPYADKRPIVYEVVSQFPNANWADIREWFPK